MIFFFAGVFFVRRPPVPSSGPREGAGGPSCRMNRPGSVPRQGLRRRLDNMTCEPEGPFETVVPRPPREARPLAGQGTGRASRGPGRTGRHSGVGCNPRQHNLRPEPDRTGGNSLFFETRARYCPDAAAEPWRGRGPTDGNDDTDDPFRDGAARHAAPPQRRTTAPFTRMTGHGSVSGTYLMTYLTTALTAEISQ